MENFIVYAMSFCLKYRTLLPGNVKRHMFNRIYIIFSVSFRSQQKSFFQLRLHYQEHLIFPGKNTPKNTLFIGQLPVPTFGFKAFQTFSEIQYLFVHAAVSNTTQSKNSLSSVFSFNFSHKSRFF